MATQERGGAAFGRLMAERVRELEQAQGEAISLARITRMVFAHLVDQDRSYDQQQTTRVLRGERAYPDAEEANAWCEALQLAGKRRALAFWVCGLIPPEVTPEQLAKAMDGGASKSVIRRHLSTPIRAGATTTGRRSTRASRATLQSASLAGHRTSHANLSAIVCHGERIRRAA